MPSITWTLQKTCENCDADIILTSELGERFKLSEAQRNRELYTRAKAWVSEHANRPLHMPQEYLPFVTPHPEGTGFNRIPYFTINPEPKYFYIKCPVCNERIYVC